MKYSLAILSLVTIVSSSAFAAEPFLNPNFRFANASESASFLGTADDFTRQLTTLDIGLRRGTKAPIPMRDHLQYLSRQTVDWKVSEIEQMQTSLELLKEGVRRLGIKARLPYEILLIHSTGQDEFASAYTRRNAIVLPSVPHPKVLFHEFFHVLSRYNPQLRPALYAVAGFHRTGVFRVPDQLRARIITNPDATELDYSVQVITQGQTAEVIPLVLSSKAIDDISGSVNLDDVLQVKLARIDGSFSILEIDQTDYLEQTKANSAYMVHPEEILAENFRLLLTQEMNLSTAAPRHPEALQNLKQVLQSSRF